MGPENLREYSTKEAMPPTLAMTPFIYMNAPKTLTSESERLFMKLTEGPVIVP